MRRTISDDASLSTDIKSDISFVKRQKELRNLYRDFRDMIDNIQSTSTTKVNAEEEEEEEIVEEEMESESSDNSMFLSDENNEEEEESQKETKTKQKGKKKAGKDSIPNDLDLIIQEIEMLQSEAKEIVKLLNKSQLSKNPRVKSIKAQLQYVNHINEGLKDRAYRLRMQYA